MGNCQPMGWSRWTLTIELSPLPGCHWWQMKVCLLGSPILKMWNNPGGAWNPGQGTTQYILAWSLSWFTWDFQSFLQRRWTPNLEFLFIHAFDSFGSVCQKSTLHITTHNFRIFASENPPLFGDDCNIRTLPSCFKTPPFFLVRWIPLVNCPELMFFVTGLAMCFFLDLP